MPPFKDGVAVNTIERAGLEIKYLRITAGPQRGRYVHQVVMEGILGRPLLPGEEVDHKNGDTFDNGYDNLQLLDISEHAKETRRRQKEKRAAAHVDAEPCPF
jgi:hypothetical protein